MHPRHSQIPPPRLNLLEERSVNGFRLNRAYPAQMHIPDGYLSPQTDAVLGLGSVLAGTFAAYKTGKNSFGRSLPLLALGAAFSFTLMMFNIPIPDGTTAHAVGGTLLAVLMGPWAAMISISVALVIQALFFGDGGVLALGANIFNMGVILPLVSYAVYRLATFRSQITSRRRWLGAAAAGYIGLNVTALCVGIELGLQPLLFHTAKGLPLYSPYGLEVAVPAMLFAHLTVAGGVEAAVSALVIAYLQKANPALLQLRQAQKPDIRPRWSKAIVIVLVLALLSPLGLLASGSAWGEWNPEQIQAQLGFIPAGLAKWNGFWRLSLLPDYGLPGDQQAFWLQAFGYLASAFTGLSVIGLIFWVFHHFRRKGENQDGTAGLAAKK